MLDIATVVDNAHQHIRYRRNDGWSARCTQDKKELAIFGHNSWRHRREWPLSWPHRICRPLNQPIGVGYPDLGSKVIHLIVEQETEISRHHLRTKSAIQRGRNRHRISVLIYYRVVGSLRGLSSQRRHFVQIGKATGRTSQLFADAGVLRID